MHGLLGLTLDCGSLTACFEVLQGSIIHGACGVESFHMLLKKWNYWQIHLFRQICVAFQSLNLTPQQQCIHSSCLICFDRLDPLVLNTELIGNHEFQIKSTPSHQKGSQWLLLHELKLSINILAWNQILSFLHCYRGK